MHFIAKISDSALFSSVGINFKSNSYLINTTLMVYIKGSLIIIHFFHSLFSLESSLGFDLNKASKGFLINLVANHVNVSLFQ